MENRKKEVNVETLSEDQAALIGEELGKKLGQISEEYVQNINKLTKIYGLEAKVAIQLIEIKTGKVLT